jgi:TP901 family phage tail tape measure protein
MSDNYTLTIIVQGEDQTAPAVQGMERLGVGGIAAGNLLASAMQAAAGAVTGFVGASISAAGDFQTNMSVLQAASGATAAQMNQLSATAMALGNDMQLPGASAGDAATAMLELSKAGLTVDQTMAAAKGTLQLAAAAETDAATAAGVVAGALNAFHLEGTAAAQIADQLAAGANASAASMTDLSQGFQAAGFAFNATGQHTDDLIASLSMLTNVGLTGSDAGTALKNAMMQLMAPTDAAAKMMAQYGINVRDAQGNMLPFRDIIGVLQDKLGGLTAAQREMALKTILQGDGMKAMLPLLEAGVAGFDAMKVKVNQAGAAQDMAAAQMAGFNGAMGGLSNAVETLQLVIGGALLPVLTFLINMLAAPAINAITTFIMALQGNADSIAQLAPPIQALMGFLANLWTAVSEVVGAFNDAGTMSSEFGEAMDLVGQALGLPANLLQDVVFGVQRFVTALWPAIDAIGAFVVGAGDFGTVADLLIDFFGVTIGGLLADAVGVIYDYAQVWIDLGATIANVVSALIGGDLAGVWSALTGGIAQVVADYQMYASSLAQLLFDLGAALVGAVMTYGPILYQQFLAWGQGLSDWIAPYIPIALAALNTLIIQIGAWIVGQASILYQQVLAWGAAFIGWIAPYIGLAITQLSLFAAQISAWITTQAPLWAAQLLLWGQTFIGWISPTITLARSALSSLGQSLLGWIGAQAAPLLASFNSWATAFIVWIPGATIAFLQAWPGMLSSFLDWVTSAVAPIAAQFATWIPGILVALGSIAAAILVWIGETAGVLLLKLAEWGIAIAAWIAPSIPPLLAALGGLITSAWAWVQEQAPGWLAQLMTWGAAFVAWIGPMIPPAIAALGGLAASFFAWIGEQAAPIIAQLGVWATAFVAWIPGATVSFLAAWPGMLGSFLDWIASAAGPLLAQLAIWTAQFIGWAIQMLPGFLLAVAGIALALGAFILETAAVLAVKLLVWAKAFEDWAKGLWPSFVAGLNSVNTGMWAWITDLRNAALQKMADVGRAIIDGIVSGVTSGVGKLMDSVKNAANKALDAAKSALGIHSPSAVMAAQVGAPIVDGIAMGIKTASPKAVGAMLDLASKLIDVVSKGVDAFGKLSQLGTIPAGAVARFADSIMGALTVFSSMTQTWDKASMSAASQFTKKAGDVVDMLAKGVDFLLKLQTLQAIPGQAIHNFVNALDLTMREIVTISTVQMRIGLMGAVEFAGGAGKILETIGKGVDGFAKLSDFAAPTTAAFLAFRDSVVLAVGYMVQITGWFASYPVASATAFAESAGKIITVIGGGVEQLAKLGDFTAPSAAAFIIFRDALVNAVGYFIQITGWFAQYPVAAAVDFATNAGKIVGIIGGAVDGFAKLRTFEAVPLAAFRSFGAALQAATAMMISVAQLFEVHAVEAASVFATSAGKMTAIVGGAVDGFVKLADFKGVTDSAFLDFKSAMFYTVDLFVAMAADWDAKAVEAAGIFATSAGKVVGILGSGVEGFTKLADLRPVADGAIQIFVTMINDLMIRIGAAASGFSADAIAAAGQFADAAGKAVGILKNGVEGLLFVDTFAGVSQDAIDRFGAGVRMAVAKMAQLAAEFGVDATQAAQAFAQAAGESTDFLKKGVDGFVKLDDLTAVPQQSLDVFAQAVVALISTIIRLSGVLSTDVLLQANLFAKSIDSVITIIKSGLEAMTKMGEETGNIQIFTQRIINSIADISAALVTQAKPASMNIGANIALGIAAGITSQAGAIQNAVYAAVNQALAAARAALGIASPSKVFEQQIGVQMSAGMAQGVLGGMGQVQSAVSQVSDSAVGGVRGGTTNNNQRSISIVFEAGAFSGDVKNPRATADTIVIEIERRLGMQGA